MKIDSGGKYSTFNEVENPFTGKFRRVKLMSSRSKESERNGMRNMFSLTFFYKKMNNTKYKKLLRLLK